MKNQTAGLIVVLALLGASGMALSWAAPALAQTSGPGPAPAYTVQAGTTAGGGYQLTSLTWRVSGTISGGTYALTIPDQPALRGNGCCCTYLPVVLRNK